ncbi:MAG: hypothetical protein KatS3mg111_3033 [Pirellulaceae bacterium]|nr:MAG: hypothetical protein KatS3mg111_3033 [Pirellulaceae bacterium]
MRLPLTCLLWAIMICGVLPMALGADNTERDFGWQIADDGVLEYIIQISPSQAAQMQANHLENLSALPDELVGRARRIVVRIGTEPLPRAPSLEEIKRTIPRQTDPADVTAALGPGRIAELEGGQVVDVQNGLPQLPSIGSAQTVPSTSPSPSAVNGGGSKFADLAPPYAGGQQATTNSDVPSLIPPTSPTTNATSPPGNQFLESARNPSRGSSPSANSTAGNAPTTGSTMPGNLNSVSPYASSTKFADTAPRDASGAASGIPAQRTPASGFGSTPGSLGNWRSNGEYEAPATPSPNYMAGNSASSLPPTYQGQDRGIPAQEPATGNAYGNPNGDYSNRWSGAQGPTDPRTSTGNGNYMNAYPNTNPYPPGYEAPDARMATLPPAATPAPPANGYVPPHQPPSTSPSPPLPSTSPIASSSPAAAEPVSPSANVGPTNVGPTTQNTSTTGLVLLQMFFLISLLANVYLGFLMKKLLTRYRNLLATVRGHATS